MKNTTNILLSIIVVLLMVIAVNTYSVVQILNSGEIDVRILEDATK